MIETAPKPDRRNTARNAQDAQEIPSAVDPEVSAFSLEENPLGTAQPLQEVTTFPPEKRDLRQQEIETEPARIVFTGAVVIPTFGILKDDSVIPVPDQFQFPQTKLRMLKPEAFLELYERLKAHRKELQARIIEEE